MSDVALHYAPGAIKKPKRVGRGPGSGHGKTACRGAKGQKARAGKKLKPSFEGGQMRLERRLPKRGFTNIFKTDYQVINLDALRTWDQGAVVDPAALKTRRVIRHSDQPVKVLGDGILDKPLTVRAHAFSESARSKIEAAGGTVEVIGR